MKKASEYRQNAEQCRVLAKGMSGDEQREQLLRMAETWDKLAVDRAARIARHPELALPDEQREESAHQARQIRSGS